MKGNDMPEGKFTQRAEDLYDNPPLEIEDSIAEKWLDTDLMVLYKEFQDLMADVLTLPWDASIRVMEGHRQLMLAHPFIPTYDRERFYCAALEQALLWEVG